MFEHIEADEYARLITVASILQLKTKMLALETDNVGRENFVEWLNNTYAIVTGEIIVDHLLSEMLIKVDDQNGIHLTERGDEYINEISE